MNDGCNWNDTADGDKKNDALNGKRNGSCGSCDGKNEKYDAPDGTNENWKVYEKVALQYPFLTVKIII
ncbi:MAG TPA: hypothetical protein DCG49_03865 [Ruminococcus sp.]|nr:hypothetical protein [Ruminococcus sp.]